MENWGEERGKERLFLGILHLPGHESLLSRYPTLPFAASSLWHLIIELEKTGKCKLKPKPKDEIQAFKAIYLYESPF